MKANGLSASSYQTYSDCEWKYYLQYILGFQSESGPAALIGTISHAVLEILSKASMINHDKNSKIWDINYLFKICYNHFCNKDPLSAEKIDKSKLKKIAISLHELVASECTPIRNNTIGIEVSFDIPIKELEFELPISDKEKKYFTVRGRIDRVDLINDDTIEIIDYKTGSRTNWDSNDRHKITSIDLIEKIQPRLYHLAAKHLYPWAKNILVTFIYISDGGPITCIFDNNDIQITKNIVRRRMKSMHSNDNPLQNKGWHCKVLCSYYHNGICESVHNEFAELGKGFTENKYNILNNKGK